MPPKQSVDSYVTEWKLADPTFHLKTRSLWNQFLFFFFFYLSGLLACQGCAALRGAVVSERFLLVLNPSISLCPGKKYIRMKLKRMPKRRPGRVRGVKKKELLSNNSLWYWKNEDKTNGGFAKWEKAEFCFSD